MAMPFLKKIFCAVLALLIFAMPARAQVQQGYQQLFELNAQELSGLKAVLKPLSSDLLTIDAQFQALQIQMQRQKTVTDFIRKKAKELEDIDSQLSLKEQFLKLEVKDLLKKLENFMLVFYRVKVNTARPFFQATAPSDVFFQDYLMKGIKTQLLSQLTSLAAQVSEQQKIHSNLNAIRAQVSLYDQRLQQSSQVIAEQIAYQKELLGQKQHEAEFFQKAFQEARREQEVLNARIEKVSKESRFGAESSAESFEWPVEPKLGISSRYLDKAYEERFGVEHLGIDIPTDQLTPVRASRGGLVATVHDGGESGYSYLQLVHSDGFSTVYGHLYSFLVKEGEQVEQGQVIAFSGGALGTKGAGKLTTGPHLHFEVLKNGQHIDPQGVLNRE